MLSQKLIIDFANGIHFRPAGEISGLAMNYQSTIQFITKQKAVNAKSMLNLLGSGTREGDEVEIVVSGPDEEEAMKSMLALIDEIRQEKYKEGEFE